MITAPEGINTCIDDFPCCLASFNSTSKSILLVLEYNSLIGI
jgi:hypothetical protein